MWCFLGSVFALRVVPPLGGIMCHLHLASHVSSRTSADGPRTGASKARFFLDLVTLSRPPTRTLWTRQRSPVPCPHTLPVPLSTVPISNPFRLLHSQWRPPQAASQRPSQMRANPCLCLIPPQSIPHATPVPFLMRNASCYPLFRSISVASVLRASH